MPNAAKLYLTEEDYKVLESVIERFPDSTHIEFLEEEIDRAEIVPREEIPDNVVTLHSRVRVVDGTTAQERELTVVPPAEATAAGEGKVSVLSPLGAAVIGLSEGQVIDWPAPSGSSRRFRVKKVVYQPAAARKGRLIAA